jgi:hypothetical protein
MKKCSLLIIAAVLVILTSVDTPFAWQGRMDGMGGPFGLVSDESDFLIHPAKIADGSGSNYYGDYKFNYVQVPKWNNVFSELGSTVINAMEAGSIRAHYMSLGGTWALGPGRLGLFVQYSDDRGAYNGSQSGAVGFSSVSLNTQDKPFAVKLLYGLPLGSWKLGTELRYTYNTSNNSNRWSQPGSSVTNEYWINAPNPYGFPINLKWNEASLKLSAETAVGPGVLTFTPKIAATFGIGKSDLTNGAFFIAGTGDITGWNAGADLWYRIRIDNTTTLPFVVRANYDRKRADLSVSWSTGITESDAYIYRNFVFEAGAGIDKDLSREVKIASGIYYNYIEGKTSLAANPSGGTGPYTNTSPFETDNRIVLKTAGEYAFSPTVTARAGINAFYGWVKDTYSAAFATAPEDASASGYRWGLNAAAGATVKILKLSFEPFVMSGLQRTDLNKSSGSFTQGVQARKNEWNVGGGLSIKY